MVEENLISYLSPTSLILFCFLLQLFLALPDIRCQFEGRSASMGVWSLLIGSCDWDSNVWSIGGIGWFVIS